MRLFHFVLNLKPKNTAQEKIFSKIVGLIQESLKNRKKLEVDIRSRILPIEWLSILLLLILIVFFIFGQNDGTFISVVISTLLALATTVLVFVLKDINDLKWKEQQHNWRPLHSLFKELRLIPYYPEPVFKKNITQLQKGEKIRIAKYTNPYPDMSGKTVETIIID